MFRYVILFTAWEAMCFLGCGKQPTSTDGEGRIAIDIVWTEEKQNGFGFPPEVVKVRVTVEPETIVRTFDANLLHVEISGLSTGTYSVQVEGLDDRGAAMYEGSAEGIVVMSTKKRPVLVIMKPALPSTPTLHVSGPTSDGTYTLQWTADLRAQTYVLQEATRATFEDSVVVYAGSETRKEITGKPQGRYYYRVKALNDAGGSEWSQIVVVEVSPPETQGSAVTITSPTNGERVSGMVDIVVAVPDELEGVWVHFYVDNTWKESIFKGPFVYSWDTSGESIGSHRLWAEANDAAGNVSRSPVVTVTVIPVSQPAEMVLIPAGRFRMGSPEGQGNNDEHPQHEVYVDAVYMDRYEITYAQYMLFNPDHPIGLGEKHPVTNVSWYDAARYCNWRSRQEGLELCYDFVSWVCDFSKVGYRLPTEAEWEKAARGGLVGMTYPWGEEDPAGKANYLLLGTSPVGSYAPNAYGLYDMAGNVWEWCQDWYAAGYYRESPTSNPTGPTSGDGRVLRGGSRSEGPTHLRCASRSFNDPALEHTTVGFRCVRRAP